MCKYMGKRYRRLRLVPDPAHVRVGRILHPDWVDLNILKQWKDACLRKHGSKCKNPMRIEPVQPAWIIDIRKNCLCPGRGKHANRYIALSYRWGKSSNRKVQGSIMGKLQEPNAMESPEFDAIVTPIVRHAIHLTSVLGERYLWVDSLCIDHEDKAATVEQLNMMGAIYANAVVTIVATDEDAQVGILGLKGISASRNLKQHVIPFGSDEIIVRNTNEDDLKHGTDYHSRCWTYQEYMMSQRKIFFTHKTVHWQCQQGTSHEDTILRDQKERSLKLRLEPILAGFPDLEAFWRIVSDYNHRDLTYAEDALSGISGLLSVASRTFTGGFLYGLPLMFFDLALGWRPDKLSNLRRRVPSSRPAKERLGPSELPSWSWVGWQGGIEITTQEAIRANLNSPARRIHSTWFENRESFKDLTKPLPPGWTRKPARPPLNISESSLPLICPDGCSQDWLFKHCNWPIKKDSRTRENWYYPFPVNDTQVSTPATPAQTPYLLCSTKRAILLAQTRIKEDRDEIGLGLYTVAGKKAGSLYLHNKQQLDLLIGSDNGSGTPVELVAIYRSRIYGRYNPLETIHTYEALWVEWKDGIVYRLAIASVDKDVWEGLDLEDISLVWG
ncbi:heterokaryon incompatibility protein-domain-containing protein [Biscogniauxia mediterranea]|nr:heterokaryon incompatibility protein-domain-containing protein [Biscogniauxia mediterranea]